MSLVLALALATVTATPVSGVPSPRAQGAWITDLANVIPPAAEGRMNMLISRLERDLGAEIVVVTVDDCEGTPKAFATALFLEWGIGKAGADNGLLILLVMGQRRLEMETGYGLGAVLPDGWLSQIQQETMVPKLKAGEHGAALEAGLVRVEAEIRAHQAQLTARRAGALPSEAGAIPPRAAGPAVRAASVGGGFFTGAAALLLTFVVLPVGFVLVLERKRKQERTCSRCSEQMGTLDEQADDAHLTEGQQKEESIGSMDYVVYACEPCQLTRVVPRSKWFSGYGKCSACSFKTLQRRTVTLRHATYSHGGEVQVTETCAHCHHRSTFTRSTPRLTRSSSSSSSSSRSSSSSSSRSSGFGGGRSGGGGAGSSW